MRISVSPMTNTATSQDLYQCAVNAIEKSTLSGDRMTSIAINGARALRVESMGMVKLLKDSPNQAICTKKICVNPRLT